MLPNDGKMSSFVCCIVNYRVFLYSQPPAQKFFGSVKKSLFRGWKSITTQRSA